MTSLGLPNLCVPQLQRQRRSRLHRFFPPCGVPSGDPNGHGGAFSKMTRILSRKNTENCKKAKTSYFSRVTTDQITNDGYDIANKTPNFLLISMPIVSSTVITDHWGKKTPIESVHWILTSMLVCKMLLFFRPFQNWSHGKTTVRQIPS